MPFLAPVGCPLVCEGAGGVPEVGAGGRGLKAGDRSRIMLLRGTTCTCLSALSLATSNSCSTACWHRSTTAEEAWADERGAIGRGGAAPPLTASCMPSQVDSLSDDMDADSAAADSREAPPLSLILLFPVVATSAILMAATSASNEAMRGFESREEGGRGGRR